MSKAAISPECAIAGAIACAIYSELACASFCGLALAIALASLFCSRAMWLLAAASLRFSLNSDTWARSSRAAGWSNFGPFWP